MSKKRLFNDGWEFAKTPFGTTLEQLSEISATISAVIGTGANTGNGADAGTEIAFAEVDLPHDWLIYDTTRLYETSTGWYRKHFTLTKEEGKIYKICFDGVYMDSRVYVNDTLVGEWKYGYSAFSMDITKYLLDGENVIAVRVDHHEPNSRWYSGAGIFRDVWFMEAPMVHLEAEGIYIATKKSGEDFVVEIEAEIFDSRDARILAQYAYAKNVDGTVVIPNEVSTAQIQIINDNSVILEGELQTTWSGEQKVSEYNGNSLLCGSFTVEKPLLWDAENPNLYTLVITLPNGDSEEVRFGFREFVFDPANGFFVNGKYVKLHGVCEHHDLGCLGAAFNKAAMRRKIKTLKEMGVNSIRTSHNMPAKGLMELADEMGMYIDSEAFDMWQKPKTEFDYARFFDDWAETDVASWVRRDRNHPSVIMWSIGNEILDTHEPQGVDLTRRLMSAVLLHDPKLNARVTIGSNYMPWQGAQNCADITKMAGYNYSDNHYDSHHEKHPDWLIYGSETSSVVQSRGVYHFPLSKQILTEEDEQCSSLGNSRPSWAARTVEHCIAVDRDRDFAAGQYLWTGFDYIGEPTPYKTKNSYFGQIDTAGFPKDAFYLYQAEWTDYKKAPMVHVFPYWDFNEGQIIDVRVCSNAPKVEVFVNGESLGVCEINHHSGEEMFPSYRVPYKKGSLMAVAYDEDGTEVAREEHRSFGDSVKIIAKADKDILFVDGQDLIFVEISTEDAEGNPVENAMDYVEVSVSGAGRLIGLDNGDSTDFDQYKGRVRKLFNGKLLAVVAAKKEAGEIKVEIKEAFGGTRLTAAELVLQAVCVEGCDFTGVSYKQENQYEPLITGKEGMVPVRKIELVSEDGQAFDENKKDILVKVYLSPKDATDKDVIFTAVNDAGIISNLAEIELIDLPEGDEAVSACLIHAKGDGRFNLRATSKNMTDKVKLMTQLEFSVSGLGEAYHDPYGFIAGALYTKSKGDVGGFSEKSAATAQEGISWLGYEGLDFGEFGADEITLPIFAQSGDPHYLQIWEGMPDEEGSEMLADVIYQKPSTWDVYKPETYKLKRRIKGVKTLCLVVKDQRYFIKGFSFTKPVKAYEKIGATEYQNLYGDTFKIEKDAITSIGNNVSIEFTDMDFGEEGLKSVTICGRTKLPNNTIHVRFFTENGASLNQIVEFPHSEDYTEITFDLEKVVGMTKVGFIFLPGCDFDFKWFKFC